jgi:hypothetical protein
MSRALFFLKKERKNAFKKKAGKNSFGVLF